MTEFPETAVPKDRPARLTLQSFAHAVSDELFNLHRGLVGTFLALWRRPGTTIRRYIEWRDPALTPPLRYLIVSLAVSALAGHLLGYQSGFAEGATRAAESEAMDTERLKELISQFWLWLAALPALAVALERAYRSTINSAEALAFSSYAIAQISLGFLGLLTIAEKLPIPRGGSAEGAVFVSLIALAPVYFILACHGYFRREGFGLGRAVAATVYALMLLALFTMAVLFVAMMLSQR